MLEQLVRVHDVERAVAEREAVHVAGLEADIGHAPAARGAPRLGQNIAGGVDADDPSLARQCGQIGGDRARAAADIKDVSAPAAAGRSGIRLSSARSATGASAARCHGGRAGTYRVQSA